jgi:RND family efflux transporter MFP subunit
VDAIRQEAGIPVEVAPAVTGTLVVRREFTGTLRGIRSVTVRARTGDEIVAIPAEVGRRVEAGDVLVRQSSQGSMASARQAEAAYQQARRSVDRLRPLREEGAISEQDWDAAETGLRVAQANLDAARRAIELTSPIAGVVTDVLATRGAMPESGDPLVRVCDFSQLQVLVHVSADQVRELARGQPAELPEHGLAGTVTRVALQADPVSRLIEIELTFDAPPAGAVHGGDIVPGAIVTAAVEVGRRDSALIIPRGAVRGTEVWVVDSLDVAHRRSVTLGLAGDRGVEVLDGLATGERVVVAGASLLSEGAKARVVG